MTGFLFRPFRNFGCRIYDDLQFKGYRAITLENELLQISLLLNKGGEPIRWLHKQTDTDLIWIADRNLLPSHPLYADYQMSYFGGWQEMFPEVSETHMYRGAVLHRGESALLPWDYEIVKDEPQEIAIRLTARMQSMPFRIVKTIRLSSGSAKASVEETVLNESPTARLEANWGHHLAFGKPFLQENAIIEFHREATIHHPVTGEQWNWPEMKAGDHRIDLSRLPPPGTQRDLLYVMTPDGEYRIVSPERKIAVKLRWDRGIWPYVWYWQNFRSDADHPFYGCDYNIGLEMFNIPPKLTVEQAVSAGMALEIPPLGHVTSWLEVDIVPLDVS